MKEEIRKALAARKKAVITDPALTDAAVLLPLFEKDGHCHIIFTKRTDHLTHHKGQISFPGGARHEGDRDLKETALRESREEIGLRPADVEILGEIDDAATVTSGYRIAPYIGVIPYPYKFKIDRFEVDEVFDLPLAALMDEAVMKEENMVYADKLIRVYTFELNGRVIWGATAWMLKQFLDIVRKVSGAHRKS